MDALHIAVALAVLPELAEPDDAVLFATRDAEQARAAGAAGLAVI
ncbi:MAG TPA: hypothetical protein VE623_02990 [Acidimicrobiales bacterium]|nr:hypothetical protein [Acidimicrobiales bacterium]